MERDDFKKHTTRRVVFRLDYLPLEEQLLERIRTKFITDFIKNGTFETYGESYAKNYEINAPRFDSGNIEDSRIVLEGKLKTTVKTYEYYTEIGGIVSKKLTLCRSFLGLEINQDTEYLKFEQYEENILDAIKIIREIAQGTLVPTRCGLRKLNDVKLTTDVKLGDYFNETTLGITIPSINHISTQRCSHRYALKHSDDMDINYILSMLPGQFENRLAVRVSFDIDVYTNNRNHLENIVNIENLEGNIISNMELEKFNKIIFDFFLATLNPTFASKLTSSDKISDEAILDGVIENE